MKSLTINGKEYRVLRLLGKGKGGYSYLVTDGQREYVLKQIHHEPCDYYQFGDKLNAELSAYETLSALDIPLPRLLDVDREQERLLKEYIPGPTVFDLICRGEMQENYICQVREMCRKLYAANLNIDYFPTNFVVWEDKLYYVDYECNGYMEQWDFDHWGVAYWSRTPAFEAHLSRINK